MMKKICFVTTLPITLKLFVLDTAKKLYEDEGYSVTFICDKDDDFSKSLPPYINYIPVSMKRGISITGIISFIKLWYIFSKYKFDIVQYSTPNAAFYSSMAAGLARIKVRLYCQWGIRYVGLTGVKRNIFKYVEKITCLLSTHVRAVSYKNLEFGIKERLYPKEKVKVNGQGGTIGVNLDLYNLNNKELYRNQIRKMYGLENQIIFGFVGRISKDKGCEELFQAFLNIQKENRDVVLLMIGPNDSKSNTIDFELIKKVKACHKIIFTGIIDSSEIYKYFAAIDIHVHPTYREGFGMVIQETAAMKTAIITTNIPGASEVMEEGISCLLVPPKNIKLLENNMRLLMNDEILRYSLANNARKRVEKCFNRKLMIENQLRDYKKIMGD